MKEYRIDAKIRNNLILKKIEETGCKTVGEFCKKYKFSQTALGNLINLKEKAIDSFMNWRSIVIRISEIFGCSPEDIITEDQKNIELKTNRRFIEINKAQIEYCNKNPGYLIEHMSPEDFIIDEGRKKLIKEALEFLSPNRRKVIEMRLFQDKTLKECGEALGLTTERIRQIEAVALRKLKTYFSSRGIDVKNYF